jgi:hypothetical protein
MSRVRIKHAALAILLCSYPGVVAAQTSPKLEAAQHFDRGLSLAKQKAYPEAIVELNRAYQASPHFSVMYNLGQAYLAIDQPVYAVLALRRYLAEGNVQVPPERRQQVEATIAAQERRIATLVVGSDIAGAVIRIDGVEIGRTPLPSPIRLGAGNHTINAALPGYETWEQSLSLAGQEQKRADIRFERMLAPAAPPPVAPAAAVVPMPATARVAAVPQPTAPSSSAAPPPQANVPSAPVTAPGAGPGPTTPPTTPNAPSGASTTQPVPAAASSGPTSASGSAPATSRTRRIAGYLVGTAGIGSLVVGSVFGLRAFSKKSDSDQECPSEQCSAKGVGLNDQAKTAATVSTITFGVGLAAVGVATYLLLSRPNSAGPTPTGTLAHGIAVAPEVGHGHAGVSVGGVW